ncbi:MAG: nicotinic acid mononucleotide adenylyltransferase [Pseudomonadales bacterium]|nr:nicotinic acid mononucleotide adenylyltransferase [Pseudomonadales bacterium]
MDISATNATGVLGGTFDPIHTGHLRLAWEAKCRLQLNFVRLVPCHLPTHRESPDTTAKHRLTMAELACIGVPGFEVDNWEINRHEPSYSVSTLLHVRDRIGPDAPLVFIMGMDAFNQFSRWHQWQTLLGVAHLWVAHRPGNRLPQPGTTEHQLLQQRQGSADQLQLRPSGHIYVHETTALDISATKLRQQIAEGITPRFLLPDAVWDYIQQHKLYGYRNEHTAND